MKPSSIAIAAAALLSAAAFAQTESPQAAPTQSSAFQALDADHDGKISPDEAQVAPVVSRSFTTADKDKDGKISQDEFNQSFTTAAPAPQTESPSTTAPPTTPPPPQ
jgi:EF hand domain-containing protein